MKTVSSKTKIMGAILGVIFLSSCATTVPRTKWTDKSMRTMIDPDSVSEEHYVEIQKSLVKSGKFTVVDRARAMNALKKEQERTHRTEEDRFADKEKWSQWGKMYGVGSIVVAHVQCSKENSTFNRTKLYLKCRQYLSMVDSNTGEVFLAVEGENEGPSSYDLSYIVPNWDETVTKLVDAYPASFRSENYAKTVTDYQDVSAEHAQRQRELAAKKAESEKAPDEEKLKLQNRVKELEEQLSRERKPASEQ